ncbi:MAG: hypothetical protein LBV42_04570 [Methanobrevibacter sp.]|nr:hypothetical protein [Methanobrevibacter sp.]
MSLETDFERFEKSLKAGIIEHEKVSEHEHGHDRIFDWGNAFKCDTYIVKGFDREKMHNGNRSGSRITFIYCKLDKTIYFT